MAKYIAPTVADSFNCPHCGTLAHQTWFLAHAHPYKKDSLPWTVAADFEELIQTDRDLNNEQRESFLKSFAKKSTGSIFIDSNGADYALRVQNLDLSQCYSCEGISIWVYNRLIYPISDHEVAPNEDMPEEIKHDFIEAQAISTISPRGSAALLRLCIQKLCIALGEKGRSIDDDIAALVRRGLPQKLQRSLDIVRVIGNESVHPGQMNIDDDPTIVSQLLSLVNLIVDAMISQPKAINLLYEGLPQAKREAISKRDTKNQL